MLDIEQAYYIVFQNGPLSRYEEDSGKERCMPENQLPPRAVFWPEPVFAGFPSPGDVIWRKICQGFPVELFELS